MEKGEDSCYEGLPYESQGACDPRGGRCTGPADDRQRVFGVDFPVSGGFKATSHKDRPEAFVHNFCAVLP